MYVSIINTQKIKAKYQIKFDTLTSNKIKKFGRSLVEAGSKYAVSVIAENDQDIEFITNHFYNIPVPSHQTKKAMWSGDMATFIMTNYPQV